MKARAIVLVILLVLTFSAVRYLTRDRHDVASERVKSAATAPAQADREPAKPHQPTPVPLNRGHEVAEGFRGDVHPLLFGQTRLELTAQWTPVGKGRDQLHRDLNPKVYAWFTSLQPAQPKQTYTERDFSAFLPAAVSEVGQLWSLDPEKMAGFLKQFHAHPSMHLVASGRRAGPDGAFAILRAISPKYLDIGFRIHAEFYLTPDDSPLDGPQLRAWYTPAYFSGRVLVNRQAGVVEHFRLAMANDKALNVHLTVEAKGIGDRRQAHDVVRVDRMELSGGDGTLAESASWTSSLPAADANTRLAKVFYKSLEINWLPFEQAAARASGDGKPIFAVVSWGAFDDQSC